MIAIPMLEMRPPGSQQAKHLPTDIKLVNVEAKCKLRLMRFPVPPSRRQSCRTVQGPARHPARQMAGDLHKEMLRTLGGGKGSHQPQ